MRPNLANFTSTECLKTLYFNNARYQNISAHNDYTFEWLWNCPAYKAWDSIKHSGLVFIEGKPGSGKSTLVRYFRDHFCLRPRDLNQDIIAAFFYSRRDGELERSHYNMLRSLLYDILAADESFFIHFQEPFRHGGRGNISWPYETLKTILLACGNHPLRRRIFLIVDALDESTEKDRRDIARLLQVLSDSTITQCIVKVFLASRPINELPQDFMGSCNHILLQDENQEDIIKYTDEFLGDRVFHRAHAFKEQAKEYIIQNADGVFLWAVILMGQAGQFQG
jgi:hypothetical protein